MLKKKQNIVNATIIIIDILIYTEMYLCIVKFLNREHYQLEKFCSLLRRGKYLKIVKGKYVKYESMRYDKGNYNFIIEYIY